MSDDSHVQSYDMDYYPRARRGTMRGSYYFGEEHPPFARWGRPIVVVGRHGPLGGRAVRWFLARPVQSLACSRTRLTTHAHAFPRFWHSWFIDRRRIPRDGEVVLLPGTTRSRGASSSCKKLGHLSRSTFLQITRWCRCGGGGTAMMYSSRSLFFLLAAS
jgi:hypothetical protein